MNGIRLNKLLLILSLFILIAPAVFAANEITQYTDKLNYWDAENHTVIVSNTGAESVAANITHPSTFTFISGTGCATVTSTIFTCNMSTSDSSSYVVQSPGASACA